MQLEFVKHGEILVPANMECQAYVAKKKNGAGLRGDFREIRNYGYHKKFFSLLGYAFDHWCPGEISCKYGAPEKSFETFREFVTVKAGYYVVTYNPDGGFKIKPKSISFANMEQDEFERLYSNVVDVILKRILTNYRRADIDQVVMQVIGYG